MTHLPRLPLYRTQGSSSLYLPYTSHGPGPRGYVGSIPPSSSTPGRAPTVQRSAPTADRLLLLSFLTLIPAVLNASSLASSGTISSLSHPSPSSHFTRGPEVISPPPCYPITTTIEAGTAANCAEERKRSKYAALAEAHQVEPIAVETIGV